MEIMNEFDTIVVPAREENFQKIFLGEKRWYGYWINPKIISNLKYIAAYRSMPIKALTHWAKIKSIENSNSEKKYIINFETPEEIEPIKNVKLNGRTAMIIAPRYTNLAQLKKAKYFFEVFD